MVTVEFENIDYMIIAERLIVTAHMDYNAMSDPTTNNRVGLIIIGDEILTGKRQDSHFSHALTAFKPYGLRISWVHMLGDDPVNLTRMLKQTLTGPTPAFCFGGIGGTPDDRTRQCAAKALDMPLIRHPDAVADIEGQFGKQAYPIRIKMAELPEQSRIIPNPYNSIPGFSLNHHHFLPGFPELAHPMMEWVLDSYFSDHITADLDKSLFALDVMESRVVPIMEQLGKRFPSIELYSLPKMGTNPRIEMGVRGSDANMVYSAFQGLKSLLMVESIAFELVDGT
ncbi:MAG: competence/damage-inducible protein A [Magnetococcales bacterium]|nr:competence/damage-inducible protein A [Magnetococcales bacterium]